MMLKPFIDQFIIIGDTRPFIILTGDTILLHKLTRALVLKARRILAFVQELEMSFMSFEQCRL